MFLVTTFVIYSPIKQENNFSTLTEANDFLIEKGFIFEELKNNVHYWIYDRNTYGTIEAK
jgi:hypothetical protein